MAGMTVAVVLIPQAMAYAMLAGLPAVYGLYAAAVTPWIAALWGSLAQLATGPIAIMSLLVLTTLSPLAETGSQAFIELAFVLSFLVGIIYLVIGSFRFGFVMAFISHAAVKGFTSAAALIIISTQLPHLLGVEIPRQEYFYRVFWDTLMAVPDLHAFTHALGLGSLAIIIIVRKIDHRLPSGLIAMVAASLVAWFFGLDEKGVVLVQSSPAGLPGLHLPELDLSTINTLLGPAVILAMVSFAETYSVSKAVSNQTRQKVDVDQEFIGQGLANLAGSFFQCYPVSGSFSRTAVNFSSGAKTGVSSIFSSLAVVLTLLFLTPLLALIPKAALAALVINAVWTLFHPKEVFRIWKMNKNDGMVAVTVFSLSLLTKPDYALMIGVVMSMIFFLWKTMHPRIVRETKDPNVNMFVNAEWMHQPSCPQILQLRVENPIYFANAEYVSEHILEICKTSPESTKFLLLDFQAVSFIDITGIDELKYLKEELQEKGLKIAISDLHQPVLEAFLRAGFTREIEDDFLQKNKHQAISFLIAKIDHDYCRESCPFSLFHECPELKKKPPQTTA